MSASWSLVVDAPERLYVQICADIRTANSRRVKRLYWRSSIVRCCRRIYNHHEGQHSGLALQHSQPKIDSRQKKRFRNDMRVTAIVTTTRNPATEKLKQKKESWWCEAHTFILRLFSSDLPHFYRALLYSATVVRCCRLHGGLFASIQL